MMRSPAHLAFIRKLPCLACCRAPGGPVPIEAAHIRCGGPAETRGGTGLKPSDDRVVPLCAECHRDQHSIGEPAFWSRHGVDPLDYARQLYGITGQLERARDILFERLFA